MEEKEEEIKNPVQEPDTNEVDETELLKNQIKEEQEKYLRSLADHENTRKRMQKDKHDTTRFAVENVISEFLSPLDSFENALSFANQASEETQNWAKGFEMILTQFKDILVEHKVVPFNSEGNKFDPHFHEVLELEETEKHDDGTIIQEFLKGYKCGDRVLHPARVKVAKKPSKEPNSDEQKTPEEQDKELNKQNINGE